PQPVASAAAGLIVFHQLWLIVSGNYSWLNWLTVVLGIAGFSDAVLAKILPLHAPVLHPIPAAWQVVLIALGVATALLSVQPVLNLFSPNQAMNYSYNRYHLVNTYGAFGSVSKERYELVLEGTRDRVLTPATAWKEFAFKAKPGDPQRMPPQIAPYHLRLDWLVWFLPFGVHVSRAGIRVRGYDRWFLRLLGKLLVNDAAILRLMGPPPFPGEPPTYVRALFYRYRYTDRKGRAETGAWWRRELLGTYIDPVSAEMLDRV
ncbi:MAG: lipase maturation factor family protein, partial [Rhodospirillales bacterium]|nr:lipase maturation factor family protein [Acetobacter sp.]